MLLRLHRHNDDEDDDGMDESGLVMSSAPSFRFQQHKALLLAHAAANSDRSSGSGSPSSSSLLAR